MSVIELDTKSFDEAINSDNIVLVDFWASWCGPCINLTPTIEAIALANPDTVSVYKVNVDNEGSLSMRFKIRGIPYLIFFKQGEMVENIIGLASQEKIQEKIDELLWRTEKSKVILKDDEASSFVSKIAKAVVNAIENESNES